MKVVDRPLNKFKAFSLWSFSRNTINEGDDSTIPSLREQISEKWSSRLRASKTNGHSNGEPILEDELDLTQFYDINVPFRLPETKGSKRDWDDYVAMDMEMKRIGLGEQGVPAYITDDTKKELEQMLSMENGFNALLSDSISVNRSVPDVRKEK